MIKKVIIAEDDPSTRVILKATLEKVGLQVIECSNGEEAWKTLQLKNAPKLLLTDWLMPSLNGLQLCERIRKDKKYNLVYIILLTMKSQASDITKALNSGANDYIPKPFARNELIARVNVGLRMIKVQEELDEQRAKGLHLGKMATIVDISSGTAHEINNPLFTLQGNLLRIRKILKKEKALSSVESLLKSTENSGNRIERIVRSLHSLSERNQSNSAMKKIEIKKLIKTTLLLCKEKLKSEGIKIIFERTSKPLHLECNQAQIANSLLNLIINAKEAIKEEKNNKWIRIQVSESQENIKINITDSGQGLDSEIISKVFNPFFSDKPSPQNVGLGLSIAQNYVNGHNGELVYNKEAKNTCFSMILPKNQKIKKAA